MDGISGAVRYILGCNVGVLLVRDQRMSVGVGIRGLFVGKIKQRAELWISALKKLRIERFAEK